MILIAFLSNPEGVSRAVKGESQFTIKVTGTDGLAFNGSYMTMFSDGSSKSQTIEGKIPTQYAVECKIVSACFQKQTIKGLLRIDILKDNEVISWSEASAEYGIVTVATQ